MKACKQKNIADGDRMLVTVVELSSNIALEAVYSQLKRALHGIEFDHVTALSGGNTKAHDRCVSALCQVTEEALLPTMVR